MNLETQTLRLWARVQATAAEQGRSVGVDDRGVWCSGVGAAVDNRVHFPEDNGGLDALFWWLAGWGEGRSAGRREDPGGVFGFSGDYNQIINSLTYLVVDHGGDFREAPRLEALVAFYRTLPQHEREAAARVIRGTVLQDCEASPEIADKVVEFLERESCPEARYERALMEAMKMKTQSELEGLD